jgi:hypothetical protein
MRWLTQWLDRYADWGGQPIGPTLFGYIVLWRDWMSIAVVVVVTGCYVGLVGLSWQAITICVVCSAMSWSYIELCSRD